MSKTVIAMQTLQNMWPPVYLVFYMQSLYENSGVS